MPQRIKRKTQIFNEDDKPMDHTSAVATIQRVTRRALIDSYMAGETSVNIDFTETLGDDVVLLDILTLAYGEPNVPTDGGD